MKLEEAASILGVHPDTPIETLKQTYRRLALAWHPDKCANPNAKEKFQQISIAYTKLISAQSIGGKRLEDEDSDDDAGGKRGVESHEMAAFMRMFMDLVGIFNEDQSLTEDGKIPAAGVSFGMMFGSRPGAAEEWSTEDEGDVEELDDEDDDNEEDDDDCYGSEEEDGPNSNGTAWEPPAKQYSQMNLKEEASKERQSKLTQETEKGNELLEAKRKLKNAKKRVEKRRKQKEKKVREAAVKEDEEEELRQMEETKKREEEEAVIKLQNDLRLKTEAKAKQRVDLFEVIRSGNLAKVKAFIGDTLDNAKYNGSNKSGGVRHVDVRTTVMREFFASQPLLHNCIGESSPHTADNGSGSKVSNTEGRLSIAKYLLDLHTRPLNLGITDDDGRTILHLAAKREDSAILKLFLIARDESPERRTQLDINARCSKSGWTALHYAASQGNITSVRLLLEAGASLSVHAGIGKGATPLDVTKSRLQNSGHFSATHIANLLLVLKEINDAIRAVEKVKQLKEAERLLKEEKLAAARKVLAEREEREKELLERKQKQLKEKQDRDRLRDDEENSKKLSRGQGQGSVSQPCTSKTSVPSASVVPVTVTPITSTTANKSPSPHTTSGTGPAIPAADITSKSLKKKLKKGKKKEEELVLVPATIPIIRPQSGVVAVVDVASRDELVDHLLAMGFPEPDCLAAISLYGRDLDRALSWLCDRPSVPPGGSAVAGNNPGSNDSNSSGSSRDEALNSTGVGGALSSASGSAVGSLNTESMRVQKEKDLKEELRRINRAWNRKAEDEKKKADADKKQKEEERQRDLRLQQALQIQQQQQQQVQQHHLQQLLLQHQINLQQQHTQHAQHMQQQQASQRIPGLAGYSYSISPKGVLDSPISSFNGQGGTGTRFLGQSNLDLNSSYHQANSSASDVASAGLPNLQLLSMIRNGSRGPALGGLNVDDRDALHRDDLKGLGSRSLSDPYNDLNPTRVRASSLNASGGQSTPILSSQYDPQEYTTTPAGISQSRTVHPFPYSQFQGSQRHYPSPPVQVPPPPLMRSLSSGQSPLTWDDNGRPRSNTGTLPLPLPPGQSQQVFQSQQQLQEQESSRLHHQSLSQSLSHSLSQPASLSQSLSQSQSRQYQFAMNGNRTDVEDEEFIDNSLELSIKAKPFIPQYPSKNSMSPISSPPMRNLGMNSIQSSQSQTYIGTPNALAPGALSLPSSNNSDLWGIAPGPVHVPQGLGQRVQVFDKHSTGFSMSVLPSLTAVPSLDIPALQPITTQSSPFNTLLRNYSNDRSEQRTTTASSYNSLGAPLLQDLGSMEHYGSNIVDDLERYDSYPDVLPSILSSLLTQKEPDGLGTSSGGEIGSERFSQPDFLGPSSFIRERLSDQSSSLRGTGISQNPPPDLFGGTGFLSAFGGRPGSFQSSHLVSGNQDATAGLMRGALHSFQADR